MSSTIPKLVFLFLLALMGGVSAYCDGQEIREPHWWVFTSSLLLNITIYLWYRWDSMEHSFIRSRWLTCCVVVLPPIGIPVYILRRTEVGARLRATGAMLGCTLLFYIVSFAGALVGEALA
jgi:hypothetical protein